MAAQFAHYRLILASLRLIGAIEGDTFNEGSISGIQQLHNIFTSQPQWHGGQKGWLKILNYVSSSGVRDGRRGNEPTEEVMHL